VVSWNDAERAVLTTAPWEASVAIPVGQMGVLRAVAELENGRTTEDAVLLNASGGVEYADVRLLEIPITVTGRGAGEIKPDDIVVLDGGRRRRVEALSSGTDTPMTIGLLIDSSASMQNVLPDLQEAAIRFLETVMTERDRAFIVTFDTRARLIQPSTPDRALLARHIMNIRPDGLTALNDAIALGLLQFQGVKGRRALVVFSDGVDRTSRYDTDEIADLAKRVNVPIHLIASRPATVQRVVRPQIANPSDRQVLGPNVAMVGSSWANVYRAMRRVTEGSGGSLQLLRKLEDLPDVYAEIEKALRAQMLAFVRTDPGTRENEWRSIKVDVTARNVDVRAPEGYYAEW
jgi:VWFA-related protein